MRVPQLLARTFVVCVLVLAAGASARAQELPLSSDDAIPQATAAPAVLASDELPTRLPRTGARRALTISMVAWTVGVAADQATTYRFSSEYRQFLRERNPIIRGLDRNPALLVTAGSALDAASGWLVYRFLGRHHPRVAAVVFSAAAGYRSYLANYNVQMMQQVRAARH